VIVETNAGLGNIFELASANKRIVGRVTSLGRRRRVC
jgi:hypothetical protein